MGRRGQDRTRHQPPAVTFEYERTLADVETEQRQTETTSTAGDETTCPCGHREFLLEGFWAVVDGRIQTVPVEVDALTCPECGREFEAVSLEDGRVVRGEFRGWADVED